MSVEGLDVDLGRASTAWPRPVRVALVAPDPSWPDQARTWADRLGRLPGVRAVDHVGATAVPGCPAVPVLDLLLLADDPDDEALGTALEARDFDPRGGDGTQWLWRRAAIPDDEVGAAVDLRVLRPDAPAVAHHRRFRDRLRDDDEAARRYTVVRRGLAGEYPDLAAYRAAKGPVIAALLG